MIGKILLTLAVMGIAYLVIRQRQVNEAREQTPKKSQSSKSAEAAAEPGLSQDLRIASYLFMVFMVGVGAALYYYRWQDDHQILTINLHRADQVQPVSYQVYKYQLQDRSFTTTDGRQVTVASSERMEIIGLND